MHKTFGRTMFIIAGFGFGLLQGCGGGGGSSTTTFPATTSTYYTHSVAFKGYSAAFGRYSSSNLFSWGNNAFGQLGIGSTTNTSTPAAVAAPSRFAGFSVGSNHTLAFIPFRNTSSVWAWGHNGSGQLGNGSSGNANSSTVPRGISGLPNVAAVAAGGFHSMALANYSSLYAWGSNSNGQLGRNAGGDSALPVFAYDPLAGAPFRHVKRIAAGGLHSVALRTDGSVWTWGSNNYGQLGLGDTVDRYAPVQVSLPGPVKLIAAGGAFSVVVTTDDRIYVWGYNGFGQLGQNPASLPSSSTPQQVPITGIGTIKAVAAGLDHILVMNNQGTIWAWGYNGYGQLGNGTTADINSTPVSIGTFDSTLQIDGVSPILAIGHHSLAFQQRHLTGWGYNVSGQLGNGTTGNSSSPVRVSGF
ncbi:RCC1 domain-containing protein [Geobacter pickeringii]|uniref:RCC1 domain-containing protein n=1 Tax=Geobacter pickeringii TaxID=345632 RepID=UPI0006910F5A|nr:RCC1 domain-containing protein [Geobacter pickeringii]